MGLDEYSVSITTGTFLPGIVSICSDFEKDDHADHGDDYSEQHNRLKVCTSLLL